VLLPGLHVYNDSKWRFSNFASQNADFAEHGPLKFFLVKASTVRVCYIKGKARIFPEGRYAVNDIAFQVADAIPLAQQNVCFEKHSVLLDGGIKMLVEGLLTYQVVDAEKVVKKIGSDNLLRSMTFVAKAELSRVFSTIHLEQMSSSQFLTNDQKDNKDAQNASSRSMITHHIIEYITPLVEEWGVRIVNFQLESIKLADDGYARDYEEASLATAKAKANLRATQSQNDILISTSEAKAASLKIEAEGRKTAIVIEAQASASARTIEAAARNKAAESMENAFGQKLALSGQQVEFAKALKCQVLTVTQ